MYGSNGFVTNRTAIYLAGDGDLNHAIGNELETYFGSSDGETFFFERFLSLYSKYSTQTALFIDGNTANVGIGTTAPAYRLDVDGGPVRFQSGAGVFANNLLLQGNGTDAYIRPTQAKVVTRPVTGPGLIHC